tara:strand:+ start:132 stop:509 length:378 start_codon:yes stop_codon:yes gene_type:complete
MEEELWTKTMNMKKKKYWISGVLPDGCYAPHVGWNSTTMTLPKGQGVIAPMEQSKPVAVFYAYDVDDVLRYGLSVEVLDQVDDFRQWLRNVVKHGGPKVDGKPLYDAATAMRIWEAFNEKVSGAN